MAVLRRCSCQSSIWETNSRATTWIRLVKVASYFRITKLLMSSNKLRYTVRPLVELCLVRYISNNLRPFGLLDLPWESLFIITRRNTVGGTVEETRPEDDITCSCVKLIVNSHLPHICYSLALVHFSTSETSHYKCKLINQTPSSLSFLNSPRQKFRLLKDRFVPI